MAELAGDVVDAAPLGEQQGGEAVPEVIRTRRGRHPGQPACLVPAVAAPYLPVGLRPRHRIGVCVRSRPADWRHDEHVVRRAPGLHAQLREVGSERREQLHRLSPWAVDFRYETDDEPALDRDTTLALIDEIRSWAGRAIGR